MSDSVSVPADTLTRVSARMEWAAEYIGEAGGRGHTADRVAELRKYAVTLRSLVGGREATAAPEDPPPGYEVGGGQGGYYTVTDPEGNAVPGPFNGKWQGEVGAVRGAWSHYRA